MGDSKLFVDFDRFDSAIQALERHIATAHESHEAACHELEQRVATQFAHLPTINSPLQELVGLVRQRHEQTRSFLTDAWLPMLHDLVKDAAEDRATFIAENRDQ